MKNIFFIIFVSNRPNNTISHQLLDYRFQPVTAASCSVGSTH